MVGPVRAIKLKPKYIKSPELQSYTDAAQRCRNRGSPALGENSGSFTVAFDKAEADALNPDDLAGQLEHFGKGKSDGITKVMDATGSVGAVKFRVEAEKYRAEAARLRDQLAQTESQNRSSVGASSS